jgi:hypothetical protein
MSKLWIIHRNPRRRDALAHLSGLAAPDLACASPSDASFASASPPAALLVGLEGDFELELDFVHRHRDVLTNTRRFLLTTPEDVDEVQRLFSAEPHEILDAVPTKRSLRALVLSAVSHRNAESLAERRDRERIAQRFSHWFGELEVPGLLRALDPSLGRLPLLVRGAPGSGRTLLARYAELFRGTAGPTLRLDASEIHDIEDITTRLKARRNAGLTSVRTVWIDDVDIWPASLQRSLAEWIRLGAAPTDAVGAPLRWVATAGPGGGLHESLDPHLEGAFAALSLAIPAIIDHPDALTRFAERISADWTEEVGGVPRRIGDGLLAALEAHAWSGDRTAVESVLRATLAASAQNPVIRLQGDLLVDPPQQTPPSDADDIASPHTLESHANEATLESLETQPLVEDASFLDDLAELDPDLRRDPEPAGLDLDPLGHDPEGGSPTPPLPPVSEEPSTIEDFERAFLDGLPDPVTRPARDAAIPGQNADASPAHNLDPSIQFSDETFDIARNGLPDNTLFPSDKSSNDSWRRLARSLSHEIRNPLVSIRTFTELLPEHFSDASFRERFTELVGRDVAHIDEVVSRLADAAAQEKLEAAPVDVSAMLEDLLDERRDRIGQGRLLVLRELEREAPIAWADRHALEVALAGLLDRALAALPERGDLFVATRRIDRSADGTPRLRVLLRHHNPELGSADTSGLEELSSGANVLEYVLAETVVEASGGSMTIDSTDAQETLILLDLRTPA